MWSTPDLCDDFSDSIQVLPPLYQNFGGKAAFAGQVVTVKCFEDNSKVKELLFSDGKGKVLVVDGGGSLRHALIGDLIAAEAIKNGWQGIVIHGACRDAGILKDMAFGVKALAAFPVRSVRKGAGEVNIDIELSGIKVSTGMWVYSDETGIVFSKDKLT